MNCNGPSNGPSNNSNKRVQHTTASLATHAAHYVCSDCAHSPSLGIAVDKPKLKLDLKPNLASLAIGHRTSFGGSSSDSKPSEGFDRDTKGPAGLASHRIGFNSWPLPKLNSTAKSCLKKKKKTKRALEAKEEFKSQASQYLRLSDIAKSKVCWTRSVASSSTSASAITSTSTLSSSSFFRAQLSKAWNLWTFNSKLSKVT